MEIFKEEDFMPLWEVFQDAREQKVIEDTIGFIKEILSERLSVGYCFKMNNRKNTNAFSTVSNIRAKVDNHRIHYYVEPLEEEVEECDHFQQKNKDCLIRFTEWNFCPKCGETLKEESEE